MLKYIYITTTEHDYLIVCKENWLLGNFGKAWQFDGLYLKQRINSNSVIVPFLKEYTQKKAQLSYQKILGCYTGNLAPGIYPLKNLKELKKEIQPNFIKGGKIAIKDKIKRQLILSMPIEKVEEIIT